MQAIPRRKPAKISRQARSDEVTSHTSAPRRNRFGQPAFLLHVLAVFAWEPLLLPVRRRSIMKSFRKSAAPLAILSGLGIAAADAPLSTAAEKNPEAEAGRQFLAASCDADSDSYISAEEARTCAEQHFGGAGGGQEAMREEQFGAAFPGAGNTRELFGQVDEDGDGQVSRAEWMNWQEQGFSAATEASEGRMPAAEYETMEWVEEAYVRPTPVDEPGQKQ
jgi:hypothetical protein